MTLARVLTENEAVVIGTQLGVPEENMKKYHEDHEGDSVRINFLILCDWRGKTPRSTMVDFLVTTLKTTGNPRLSSIVDKVRNKGRCLVPDDFKIIVY